MPCPRLAGDVEAVSISRPQEITAACPILTKVNPGLPPLL